MWYVLDFLLSIYKLPFPFPLTSSFSSSSFGFWCKGSLGGGAFGSLDRHGKIFFYLLFQSLQNEGFNQLLVSIWAQIGKTYLYK